jgi:hypothetical protein
MHETKSQTDQPSSTKLIKAPKGSGFYLLEIPHYVGRKVPSAQGKPSVPLKWIRDAVKKVAKERELLLTQYKLEHAKSK